jgi:hypothetical protein
VVDGANVYRPDGNVGVGTSNPTERFHAVSPLFARLRLERTGGSIVETDASLSSGSVGTKSSHAFRLLTNNSVRMHIDPDGEIGIGSATPDGKLDVRASGGQDVLNLYDSGTLLMTMVSGGKVGIGVDASAPQDRLQVLTSTENVAVSGRASAATGFTRGGVFIANSPSGTGVRGEGGTYGLYGEATATSATGVFGIGAGRGVDGVATTTSGTGVHGFADGGGGYGVHGVNPSTAGSATGVKGEGGIYGVLGEGGVAGLNGNGVGSSGSFGVFGQSNSLSQGAGVVGQTGSSNGKGVWGNAYGAALYGVYGQVQSVAGWAGYFTGGRSFFQGPVGINVENPLGRFMVEAEADEEGMRVRIGGTTKFKVDSNGGLAIGANYTPPADGVAVLGNVGVGTSAPSFNLHVNGTAGKPGGGSWSVASDARLKKNVRPLRGALDSLCRVETVTYEYIDPQTIHELPDVRTGVIAQQVETVFPDWVEEAADGYKRVTFRGFEALTIEALRELRALKDAEIAQLRAEKDEEIAQLRAENSDAIARLGEEAAVELERLQVRLAAAEAATVSQAQRVAGLEGLARRLELLDPAPGAVSTAASERP